jgi:membrane protease YdiL (CAAX protease family)
LRSTIVTCTGLPASERPAFRPPKPPPIITTFVVCLPLISPTYKIADMAVGSKSFPPDTINSGASSSQNIAVVDPAQRNSKLIAVGEIVLVFLLLEAVLWTPRSFFHSLLIASLVVFLIAIGVKGRTREQLGLVWASRQGTALVLGIGLVVAVCIPALLALTGHPIPANPEWPRLRHILPYIFWAFGQQFLLLSFLYLRFEFLLGSKMAIFASAVLFTLAHLPNLPLTAMTLIGGLFFAEMFRTYRSILPLAITHALVGISIAFSFPDSLMHHMRVGLSYWAFR